MDGLQAAVINCRHVAYRCRRLRRFCGCWSGDGRRRPDRRGHWRRGWRDRLGREYGHPDASGGGWRAITRGGRRHWANAGSSHLVDCPRRAVLWSGCRDLLRLFVRRHAIARTTAGHGGHDDDADDQRRRLQPLVRIRLLGDARVLRDGDECGARVSARPRGDIRPRRRRALSARDAVRHRPVQRAAKRRACGGVRDEPGRSLRLVRLPARMDRLEYRAYRRALRRRRASDRRPHQIGYPFAS
jgi:hypothetical protein